MADEQLNFMGGRIKELRKIRGLTQEKFAEILNIDPKHLSRIECGKTQPSLNLLKKMAVYLDIKISAFFKTEHLQTSDKLIVEINKILKNSSSDKIKIYYKILCNLEI